MEATLQLHLSHLPSLVNPVDCVHISNNPNDTILDDILLEKLKDLKRKCPSFDSDRCDEKEAASKEHNEETKERTKGQDDDVRWSYVKFSISYLEKLMDLLLQLRENFDKNLSDTSNKNRLPPDALSVSQQQQISKVIQLVLVFGAIPSFAPGVGMPFSKRSKFEILFRNDLDTRYGRNEIEIAEEKYHRLVFVTDHMVKLSAHPGLADIILEKNLDDLLASLVQLSFRPLQQPNKNPADSTENQTAATTYIMTEETFLTLQQNQLNFQLYLDNVLKKVYPPKAIRSLLVLQSSGATEATRVNPLPKSINIGKRQRTPKWLQTACGNLLSKQLTAHPTQGVANVIRGILDVLGDSNNPDEGDTRKYQIIANVIGNPPKAVKEGNQSDVENYYSLVCPQLLGILSTITIDNNTLGAGTGAAENSSIYPLVASHCIQKLSEKYVNLARRHVFDVIMEPLLRLFEPCYEASRKVIIDEKEMERCIRQLNFLFTNCDPSPVFIGLLQPIVPSLLFIHYSSGGSGISYLHAIVQQLLERYLKQVSSDDALQELRAFLFYDPVISNDQGVKKHLLTQNISICPSPDGGLMAVLNNDDDSNLLDDDKIAAATCDFLQYERFKDLTTDFYLSLLKDLTKEDTNLHSEETANLLTVELSKLDTKIPLNSQQIRDDILDSCHIKEAFKKEPEEERKDADMLNQLRKQFMLLRLIGIMSQDEQLQDALMKQPKTMIEFLLSAIHRHTLYFQEKIGGGIMDNMDLNSSNMGSIKSPDLPESKTLDLAMSLLLNLIYSKEQEKTNKDVSIFDEPVWETLQSSLSDLQYLEKVHNDSNIQDAAGMLCVIIRTRGSEVGLTSTQEQIENLRIGKKKIMTEKNSYLQALDDIEDTQIPIKGHGLISLTRLVTREDKEALTNIDSVIEIFRANLEHEDTYIYLQCIHGLAACASKHINLVISILTKQFSSLDESNLGPDIVLQRRTKLGEALVRITDLEGELVIRHMNSLINPFLYLLRNNPSPHPDPLIRASSIANIGTICKNLGLGLSGIAHEIFDCLINILRSDTSTEVQRAGVAVCVMILQGLGTKLVIEILGKEGLLRDIRRVFVNMRDNIHITDDTIRKHIFLALEEIDKVAKEVILPSNSSQEMSKTIYVLDKPPDSSSATNNANILNILK